MSAPRRDHNAATFPSGANRSTMPPPNARSFIDALADDAWVCGVHSQWGLHAELVPIMFMENPETPEAFIRRRSSDALGGTSPPNSVDCSKNFGKETYSSGS